MNFTDDKLDDLFRSQLGIEKSYNNAEAQWQIVANKLNSKSNGRPFVWLFSIGLISFAAWFLFASNNTSKIETNTTLSSLQETKKSGSTITDVSVGKNPVLLTETSQVINNKDDLNTKPSVTIPDTNNNSVPNVTAYKSEENKSSKEICNCPDDLLNEENTVLSKSAYNISSNDNPYPPTLKNPKSLPEKTDKELIQKLSSLPVRNASAIVQSEERKKTIIPELSHPTIEPSKTTSKTNSRLQFSGGILKDLYNNSFLDSTAVSPFVSIGVSINKKLAINLRYNQQNNLRAMTTGFEDLELGTIYGPYPESDITQGLAKYKEQVIDLGANYDLLQFHNIGLSFLGGLQFTRQHAGTLDLTIESVYLTNTETFSLAEETIRLRKSYLGLGIEYPIISNLQIQLQYRRIIPLVNTTINWGQFYRISLGLSYKLKS